MNKFCPNCGNKIEKEGTFCVGCGFNLNNNENIKSNEDKENKGFKIASLVLGIVSIVLSFLFNFLIIPVAIVGLILGIVYSAKAKKFCAGIILNIIGILIPIIIIALIVFAFKDFSLQMDNYWENGNYIDNSSYNDSNEEKNDKYFKEMKLNELVKFINKKKSFILVVSQTGCGHCLNYKPKIRKIANDYKLKVYYIEYDLLSDDEKNEFANYLDVYSTPTTVFFEKGVENRSIRIEGDTEESELLLVLQDNGYLN